MIICLYPSSFKLLLCWLLPLTPVTSLSMLLGIRSLAAALQLEKEPEELGKTKK
ncbi:hypothetical protein [Photorhabdus antumapuensis]|uniref:hypothetical protein n=1 Tax=Photorhabdus antumapuensis TaxID=2862867 RepID=UPI001CECE528|nr:hypothetical protein [Photorhabdus antumapuensis]MCA6220467.1 hypothetical protein [Photorhabdus antumapuensis]